MHHIKAHVTRADFAKNRIKICAIVVKQSAGLVNDTLDFHDPALEDTERGWVCQHDAGGVRPDRFLQRCDVDVTFCSAWNFPDDTAAHCRRCGICAVRRIRHDDLVPILITACDVIGTNHGDTGEFSLGARHRCQRHGLHAGYRLQHLLQFVHAGKKPLAVANRSQGMPLRKSR